MLGRGFVRRAGVDIDIQKHVMLTFGTKTRINIYVDVCFGAPKACEDVILTTDDHTSLPTSRVRCGSLLNVR
jgi:hypothetical protein